MTIVLNREDVLDAFPDIEDDLGWYERNYNVEFDIGKKYYFISGEDDNIQRLIDEFYLEDYPSFAYEDDIEDSSVKIYEDDIDNEDIENEKIYAYKLTSTMTGIDLIVYSYDKDYLVSKLDEIEDTLENLINDDDAYYDKFKETFEDMDLNFVTSENLDLDEDFFEFVKTNESRF